MNAIALLTSRQLRLQWVRTLLTVLAVALSVSLVISVTSGLKSVSVLAARYLDQTMGTADAVISPRPAVQRETISQSLADRIAREPEVTRVTPRLETEARMLGADGDAIAGHSVNLVGIDRTLLPDGRQRDSAGANLKVSAGRWFEAGPDGRPTGNYCVIDQVAAKASNITTRPSKSSRPDAPFEIDPGQTIELAAPSGNLKLTVVGVIHKPEIMAMASQTVYVPLETLQQWTIGRPTTLPITGQPALAGAPVTRILIELKAGTNAEAFVKRMAPVIAALDSGARIEAASSNKENVEKNLASINVLSAAGASVTLIAAACIIFSTLSMGVSERQRQLAVLRAIGTTTGQLFRLVVLEGVGISVLGVLVALPLGYLWVAILAWQFPTLFANGILLSWPGVAYAASAALVTAVIATALPAWSASRVDPLEALAGARSTGSGRGWPIGLMSLAGALLLVPDALLLHGPVRWFWEAQGLNLVTLRGVQFWGHFACTLPLSMIGCFLLSPGVVVLAEKLLATPICAILKLPLGLVRQQVSGGLVRSAGTVCGLMVGLATLLVMHVQGESSLGAWKIPDKFPDMFIVRIGLGGLNEAEQKKLATVEGIKSGDLMPVAIASSELGNNFLAVAGAATLLPDSTLFFGIDAEQADRMTSLEFRQGNPKDAVAMMHQGRHLLVTEEFATIKNLHVGSVIRLKTIKSGLVDYTVAGVVWSPGVDVIVAMFDLGNQMQQRTASSVFGTLEDARRDFGVEEVSVFAANLVGDVSREELTTRVKKAVGKLGMAAYDIRQVKAQIQAGFREILLMASTVALAAMLVSSLGVTNVVLASVRSRRWELGVLRSIGLTRGQLMRMILAESFILGLAAAAAGVVCGAVLVSGARGMTSSLLGFRPPLTIPWSVVLGGCGAVVAVSVCAALWPAFRSSRTEPLTLLQTGRSVG